MRVRLAALLILAAGLLEGCDPAADDDPVTLAPLGPQHLALIVNDSDPLSRQIAEYYSARRLIPARNIIHIQFPPGAGVMRPEDFRPLRARILQQTPEPVQAYALTWTVPYRVGCMSITTAMAAGFHKEFCAVACQPTQASPYFDTDSRRPYDDFGWRPSMLLAGTDLAEVQALIDRGVAADGTRPAGTGYLMISSDRARNIRARFYQGIMLLQSDRFRLQILRQDGLRYRDDVMFYFTGLARVPDIATNSFLPGAIADHLTSAGGKLTDSYQMSSLRWLEAGATGSYGSVNEPCNYIEKFPRPNVVIDRYLNGETLLEAYWKSVQWPGQGLFIGEPLSAPFR
ncbi:MAG: TIGR03790 family protein [Gammaproteobacteria bacterium]|jgi:uncharacterized protein (TIGR03790 family)